MLLRNFQKILWVFLFCVSTCFASAPDLLVILDPGHGGEDTGTIQSHESSHSLFVEKDFTLSLALKAAEALRQSGIRVLLTRTHDRAMSLDERARFANRWGKEAETSIFVSLHGNSSKNPESNGIETYVFNATTNNAAKRLAEIENGKHHAATQQKQRHLDLILSDLSASGNHADSVAVACAIQGATITQLDEIYGTHSRDRGIKQALFYVLMKTQMPSVLFEPGFASNPIEVQQLLSPHYQNLLARSLTQGIRQWFSEQSGSARKTHTVSGIAKGRSCKIVQ